MPFRHTSGLRYFQFRSLNHPKLEHGIFTRRGGLSPRPWRSLNLGGTVGDDGRRVSANRERVLQASGRPVESCFDVWQVHSARVIRANGPRGKRPVVKADAIVTNLPEVTLMMRFADCVPILIFDPAQQAIGIAHAGWLGTLREVARRLVEQMQHSFGCRARDLKAGIGPSIGPDHYPIGPEVIEQVETAFGNHATDHLHHHNGATHFDLWSANQWQLESVGVRSVELSGICTACEVDDWYSHRAESGATGRFGAILGLNP